MSHRPIGLLLVLVNVASVGCQERPVREPEAAVPVVAQAPPIATDTTRVPSPTVSVSCSPTRARIGVASIQWPAERFGGADSIQVDYTVFKDGFATGQFGSLGTDRSPRVQVLFRSDRQLTAMALEVFADSTRAGLAAVRAERLDPGVTYYWRVRGRFSGRWVAGASTRASAPTCVADEPSPATRQ
jgi:hypothetical protein